jgi:microsomal dipeptidase-like Zn-dependent dipeptidase
MITEERGAKNQPIIDLHCHPGLKTFMSANIEKRRRNCWKIVSPPPLLNLFDKLLLHNVLRSQCSLRQLNRYNGSIILAGIYASENGMITSGTSSKPGTKSILLRMAQYLNWTGHFRKISTKLVRRLSLPGINYFDLFNEMQEHLLRSRSRNRGYNLLNKIDDYKEKKLNVILTIEGGHNLCYQINGNAPDRVLSNLMEIKSWQNRYFFLGLAHLEQNELCTHAYGMKMINNQNFFPAGSGITPMGMKVIKEALSDPHRILIDVKHMSIKSRLQYYSFLKENRFNDVPIIASHAGVTGVSYKNKPVLDYNLNGNRMEIQYFKTTGIVSETSFNPWSINLFDEDILTIIESKGLIGLNLDERILGTKQKRPDELVEYISIDEFDPNDYQKIKSTDNAFPLQGNDLVEYNRLMDELEDEINDLYREIDNGEISNRKFRTCLRKIKRKEDRLDKMPIVKRGRRLKQENDIFHLCNNILHIIKVGGKEAWKHICIGSDFDGLINPIEGCANATRLDHLRKELKKWLPDLANKVGLPFQNVDETVDNIMFGNAYEFLKKHFT